MDEKIFFIVYALSIGIIKYKEGTYMLLPRILCEKRGIKKRYEIKYQFYAINDITDTNLHTNIF